MDLKSEIKSIKKKILDEICFLTLRKGTRLPVGEGYFILDNELPVPLFSDDLIADIKESEKYDGLNMKKITDAMIFVIGADEEFKYNNQYKKILFMTFNNPESYIKHMFGIYSKDVYKCFVLACSLQNIYPDLTGNKYIYGNALEMIGEIFHKLNQEEKAQLFFEESASLYEKLLNEDEEFAPSYYKLGYYYKTRGQTLKAKLLWEKYISISDENETIEEIREQINKIIPVIELKECYELIENGELDEAVERLTKLNNENPGWWNALFTLGLAFRQKKQFDLAQPYFENVLKINNSSIEAMNELSLCYIQTGKFEKAEKVLDAAIVLNTESEELFSNRAVARYYLGKTDYALEDIEKALSINPQDVVAQNVERLIKKNKNDFRGK